MASDFSAIVQHPRIAFRDPVLQACDIQRDSLRRPLARAGAFAVVYKGIDPRGKAWALRAFTTESRERREHYEQITAHLKSRQLRCLVDFEYRESSIRSASDGRWYPLVVMDWVQGLTLFSWVQSKCRKGKGPSIAKGAQHWRKLIKELEAAEIAHGDLQHANVLVTPEGRLKLVDYDGMCVPALVGRRNLEIGVRPYQHPKRNESTLLSTRLDDFSSIVIYTALRALAADTSLWARHVDEPEYDKLLFRSEDFVDRERSPLYQDLMTSPDPDVRSLATQLFLFARGKMDDVPPLTQLVAAGAEGKRGKPISAPQMPWQAETPESPLADRPAARVILDVVDGPLAGKTLCIDRHDTLLFGRGADCHIRVPDDRKISRHQFLLEVVPPDVRLRDLGSRNGTHVNGVKYGGRRMPKRSAESEMVEAVAEVDLKHGDQISSGGTTLLVRVEGTPSPSAVQDSPAEPARDDAAPQQTAERLIDRLEIGEPIGTGLLGVVYKAQHRVDHRELALKVVQPKAEIGKANRAVVLRDLEPYQSLRHANIAGMLERGMLRRAFYFVMEYCSDGSLAQWLRECGGKVSLGQARPLMYQCLEGLDHAHRQGLLHGDLKPENILLHRENHQRVARLADSGLARILGNAGFSGMTATGEFSMVLHFLPRERVLDLRQGDFRSDQWSLAAVFYYMLTGRFPREFRGRDPITVILQSETIPLAERDAKMPQPIAAVIDQALSSDPEKRFRDVAQMRTMLKRAFTRLRGGSPF